MNRSDLAWALTAALPHAGTTKGPVVGLQGRDGALYVYSTDSYTAGIARIPSATECNGLDLHLPKAEAADLLRFVRPTRVAEHEQEVTFMHVNGELHVAFRVPARTADDESAVFECVTAELSLDTLLDLCRGIAHLPTGGNLVFQPPLMAKFGKAQRHETDRLSIYPHEGNDRYGVALATVGENFVGAVAGLALDPVPELLASFLQKEMVNA